MPDFGAHRAACATIADCDADLEKLLEEVGKYAPDADLSPVRRAWALARERHAGQTRASGEPYAVHPLEVAWILAGLGQDASTLAAALLHDSVEDTATTIGEIEASFGKEVAGLVDGVTKLSSIEEESKQLELAENVRKMMVATAKDVRVLLLKLADRLHNMRTLDALAPEKQDRIAHETMEIYAPLANRLGIQPLKGELEDLAFRYTNPGDYQSIVASLAKTRRARERHIAEVTSVLTQMLAERGIDSKVYGRAKHIYSIHQKMRRQNLPFEGVHDITAFRVLVDTEPRCWEVLGLVHGRWMPVPGKFRDYLSLPKSNGYRSLHTTVMGPSGERMEVQIRTKDMHRIAEDGVAAHWRYKEGGRPPRPEDLKTFSWLRSILEYGRDVEDSSEFMESAVGEMYGEDVYVFTPAGAVLSFPRGSTPVDFAYAIHTNVGHRCVGAKANGVMVPLEYRLRSGDKLEILTRPNQHPSTHWLGFARTARAKAKIRSYVRSEERKRSIEMGHDLLERRFRDSGHSLSKFEKKGSTEEVLESLKLNSMEEMFSRVGVGKLDPREVVDLVHPPPREEREESSPDAVPFTRETVDRRPEGYGGTVSVGDLDDILVRLSRCCNPVPGDPIVGFITRGRGVTIHRRSCPRAMELDPERRIDARWTVKEGSLHPVRLTVVCEDRPGILSKLSHPFTDGKVNIDAMKVEPMGDGRSACLFSFKVGNLSELEALIRTLEKVNGVIQVERV